MPLSDSYKKHGAKAVIYNPRTVIEVCQNVLSLLEQRGERRITTLAVAGLLVQMQAELAGDTIENTIEVMRTFIDTLRGPPPERDGN